MVPFFVVDRPNALDILAGVRLWEYPGVRMGIMTHANVTPNFRRLLQAYPCHRPQACPVIGGRPCPYANKTDCPYRTHILQHTIVMSDSGVFTQEGGRLTYPQLFERYAAMGVQYGIILDVLRDARGTVESARQALQVFRRGRYPFRLVGVAQGKTLDEYLWSYERLREMGYTHIAVGGLLHKVANSARYTRVRSARFMATVLTALRERYPTAWLFALGCLHLDRLPLFRRLNVWADSKAWLFQYPDRAAYAQRDYPLFDGLDDPFSREVRTLQATARTGAPGAWRTLWLRGYVRTIIRSTSPFGASRHAREDDKSGIIMRAYAKSARGRGE